MKIKDHEGIELVTNNMLKLFQHAPKEATANSDPQRTTNNIHYEIKKLVAEREEPGQSGKELTHQIAEENITEKSTKINPISKKYGINLLKNTSLISKGKLTLF
jgi:hypothetical protein